MIVRFYDQMEARAGDERTRRVIRRERDFMELAFYRGDMPAESALIYERLDGPELMRSLAAFRTIADRAERSHLLHDREIEQIAQGVVERVTRQLGPQLSRLTKSIDLDVARRAADPSGPA